MRILFYSIIINVLLINTSFSQEKLSTPLIPADNPNDQELGIFAGLGANSMDGRLYVDCETCLFNEATALGWELGLTYRYQIKNGFKAGISAGITDLSIESSYSETVTEIIENESYPIPYKHTANAGLTAAFFTPYIQYEFMEYVFVRSGISTAYIFHKDLEHTMSLERRRIITNDGKVIDLKLNDSFSNSVTFKDNEFKDFNNLNFYIPLQIGAKIPLSDYSDLSPSFIFNFPLNKTSSFNEGYKIINWRILFEFSYYLKK